MSRDVNLKVGTVLLSVHHEEAWLMLDVSVDWRNGISKCKWLSLHSSDIVVTDTLTESELLHYSVVEPG